MNRDDPTAMAICPSCNGCGETTTGVPCGQCRGHGETWPDGARFDRPWQQYSGPEGYAARHAAQERARLAASPDLPPDPWGSAPIDWPGVREDEPAPF